MLGDALTGTPASRMSQIVCLSSGENRAIHAPPDRRHHCPPIRQVLQRPLEATGDRGHPSHPLGTTLPGGRRSCQQPAFRGPSAGDGSRRPAPPIRLTDCCRRDIRVSSPRAVDGSSRSMRRLATVLPLASRSLGLAPCSSRNTMIRYCSSLAASDPEWLLPVFWTAR